jgi:CDP-glycerol glycerophosphotransferase (TagB/SpsB family)
MIKVNFFMNTDKDYSNYKSLHEAMIRDGNFDVNLYLSKTTKENIDNIPFADYSIISNPYNTNFKGLATKSGRICYIGYGPLIKNPLQYPIYDLHLIWRYFIGDEFNETFLKDVGQAGKIVKLGHPKFDIIQRPVNKQGILIKYGISPKKKILLYTPTIQMARGEISNYSMFKKSIGDIVSIANELGLILIIRAHALLYQDLPIEERIDFSNMDNVIFTQTDSYQELLKVTDFCISDPSGVIFEQIYTQKPLILLLPVDEKVSTKGEIPVKQNKAIIQFSKASYIPISKKSLKVILIDLIDGKDELKNERRYLLQTYFFNKPDSGKRVKNYLKRSYYGK